MSSSWDQKYLQFLAIEELRRVLDITLNHRHYPPRINFLVEEVLANVEVPEVPLVAGVPYALSTDASLLWSPLPIGSQIRIVWKVEACAEQLLHSIDVVPDLVQLLKVILEWDELSILNQENVWALYLSHTLLLCNGYHEVLATYIQDPQKSTDRCLLSHPSFVFSIVICISLRFQKVTFFIYLAVLFFDYKLLLVWPSWVIWVIVRLPIGPTPQICILRHYLAKITKRSLLTLKMSLWL
jgi:hypothetical protein